MPNYALKIMLLVAKRKVFIDTEMNGILLEILHKSTSSNQNNSQ
jgi:hypothetical protein